ncbi:hypothetical protein SAVIM40S_00041 [Streptomyces avidinii]
MIYGPTSAMLADAPLFEDIAEEFANRSRTGRRWRTTPSSTGQTIAREYARAAATAPVRQRLCTIALSKELNLPLPNYKPVESLAAHFGVVQQRAHHASTTPGCSRRRSVPRCTRPRRGACGCPCWNAGR